MLLDGKSAVVTGAGSGVGRASALRFAEEGARVICATSAPTGAGDGAELIGKADGTAAAFRADVSAEDDVIAMLDAATTHFGRLDILFNNVGVPTPRLGAKLEDHTVEDFDRLVAVNLRGVFLGCKHAVLRFKRQGGGGVILNTGSVAGLVGWGGTVYGSTKGGVHQLTRGAAIEAAPYRIRVNAICPACHAAYELPGGGGHGRRAYASVGSEAARRVGESHPLGQPITAEDCAEAAGLPGLRPGGPTSPGWRAAAGRRRVRGPVSERPPALALDRDRIRALFDLRSSYNSWTGGDFTADLQPQLAPAAGPGRGTRGHGARADWLPWLSRLPWPAHPGPPALLGVQPRGAG